MTTIVCGIAGGTGAGKTTLAEQLYNALGGEEEVNFISHDSYYKCLKGKPRAERIANNFDHPDSLETDLLVKHIQCLKQGVPCPIPSYNFATHARTDASSPMLPRRIIIVEGILLFTDQDLCNEMDIKVFVHADADIRLARRLQRDTEERGQTFDEVISQYQTTVRPMHDEWVEPSKKMADIIIQSESRSVEVALEMLTNHLRIKAKES